MDVETSDLRRALCALICNRVLNGTGEQKRWLAGTLDVLPFESIGDRALVAMARDVADTATVDQILAERSSTRYTVGGTYLCPTCQDAGVLAVDDGRYGRCANCNPRSVA